MHYRGVDGSFGWESIAGYVTEAEGNRCASRMCFQCENGTYWLYKIILNTYLMAESFPDARRVAPISACVFLQRVSGNLKCNKNGHAFDANFEHPTLQGATVPTYANPGCRFACPGLRTIIGLSARTNWVLTHPHKTSNNMTLEYHFCWIDKPVRHQHVCCSETCKAHGWQ